MITTERTVLRELSHGDFEFIIELLNSEDWIRFIGDRKVFTKEDAIRYMDNGPIKSYRSNKMGLYLASCIEDQKPIGLCGVFKREEDSMPELGFAFLKEYEGKGYAHETAQACMDDVKQRLEIETICAITVAYNHRSIRLLEKLGFTFDRKFKMDNDPEELLMYKT
ncbi:MAG TPA: GNAT family N-acetyltransferase [Bacteroidia bacterium]|nr:GNAT family N-acetyltransferase [Bacteroidia bacterium]